MASRTWVSGVGDDANPGSRTAPCKTFAGALSKTDPNGEVSVLDPGGYGTVTVTRSVTIDGGSGKGWASIMATNTNGLVVTQPNGSTELNVDRCVIAQNANGVATGDGTPIVRLADSMIVDNGVGISVTGGAVASFTNNSIAGNGTGNAPTPGSRIPLE